MKMRRWQAGLALIIVLLLLVAACGQTPAPSGGAQPTAAGGQPAAGGGQPTAGGGQAAGFDWKKYSGTKINLLLNKHPYSDAFIARLPEFTKQTGIEVTYDVVPEQNYFDKLTIDLSSGQGAYDAYMTGAYMIWQYAPAGWMEPLEKYINDPNLTSPDYDFNDIIENLRQADQWDLQPGAEHLGKGSQWAIPWGFETNALMYRKDIFEQQGIKPPKTLDELVATAKKLKTNDMAGIVVRGSKNWATIHPGYMTMYSSAGCKDYDEKMHPQMNSDCAVQVTQKWIDMVRESGPQAWTTYTWFQAGSDFGAGKAAMLFDADILGFFQNVPGGSSIAGKVAWAPGPAGADGKVKTNMWIWSLAMNANSKHKEAAWYAIQWATAKDHLTHGALEYSVVDPVRKSVWDNPAFKKRLQDFTNYYDTFQSIIADTKIQFTPQPKFFETTTEWASTLQDIYAGKVQAKEGLDQLAAKLTTLLKQSGIYKE